MYLGEHTEHGQKRRGQSEGAVVEPCCRAHGRQGQEEKQEAGEEGGNQLRGHGSGLNWKGSGSDPASHPKPWLGSKHMFHSHEATGPTRLALLWQGAVTLQMWSLRMGWYCAPLSCLWNQD